MFTSVVVGFDMHGRSVRNDFYAFKETSRAAKIIWKELSMSISNSEVLLFRERVRSESC